MNFTLNALQCRITQAYHSRLAYVASFLILTLQRSPLLLQVGKIQQWLGRPILHVAKIGTPLAAFFGSAHAVTGATGVVPAGGSKNPATATVGEAFTWVFQVSGETAESYTVRGLPAGLVKSNQILGKGISSFGGVPEESGVFSVEIIGWRNPGERGDKTPTYRLDLTVEEGMPPVIQSHPTGGEFELGSDAKLEVVAEGGGLHYRWFKDEVEIPNTRQLWIGEDTPLRVLVPTGPVEDAWLSAPSFDDHSWREGSGGVGFERSSSNTYDPYFSIDLESELYNKNNSALIRIPFSLSEDDIKRPNELMLRIQYDDGYVAFLNGTRIAEANAPPSLAWNSRATGGHDDALAVEHEEIDLNAHVGLLKVGTNLLALQVLNDGSNSSDFLCNLELLGGRNTDLPMLNLNDLTGEDSGDYAVEVSNGFGSEWSEVTQIRVAGGQTGFGTWQSEHWTELPLPSAADPDADADGDGVNNLIEYYGGSDPRHPDDFKVPVISMESTDNVPTAHLHFPRSEAVGVSPVFEVSSSLEANSWQPLEHGHDGVEITNSLEETIIRIPVSKTSHFVRLRVLLED